MDNDRIEKIARDLVAGSGKKAALDLAKDHLDNSWTTAEPKYKREAIQSLRLVSERWDGTAGHDGMTRYTFKAEHAYDEDDESGYQRGGAVVTVMVGDETWNE